MQTITATLITEINVTCPCCGDYFDIYEDGIGSNKIVVCELCHEEFLVEIKDTKN